MLDGLVHQANIYSKLKIKTLEQRLLIIVEFEQVLLSRDYFLHSIPYSVDNIFKVIDKTTITLISLFNFKTKYIRATSYYALPFLNEVFDISKPSRKEE